MEHVQRIAAVWGPAGREQKIAAVLGEQIAPYVDVVHTDRFGNLIAIKRGGAGAKRVMLAAHMDTSGAVAVDITEKGLIRLAPVGNLKAHHLIGQRVRWGSGAAGFIQHESVSSPSDIDFKRLWCDIGAIGRDEALQQVRLGDMCVLEGTLLEMGDLIAGPGLDNRAGCSLLLDVAAKLKQTAHEIIFAFTCQSHTGARGAGIAAYGAEPDLALLVDVATAGDVPGAPRVEAKLGGGPALRLRDGAHAIHQGLGDRIRKIATEQSIPLQPLITADEPSDARSINLAGQGVPVAAIDLPGRYRGSAGEMISQRDLFGAADLLLQILADDLDIDGAFTRDR